MKVESAKLELIYEDGSVQVVGVPIHQPIWISDQGVAVNQDYENASDMIKIESRVGLKSQAAEVLVRWNKEGGVLSPDEARRHAMDVMEAADASESDCFILKWAQEKAGVDFVSAVKLVADFREYRAATSGR